MAIDTIARGLALSGVGGTTYTAGDGIDITGDVISIDYPTTYIKIPDATTITQELTPNVFYKFLTLTTCTTLTLTLLNPNSINFQSNIKITGCILYALQRLDTSVWVVNTIDAVS